MKFSFCSSLVLFRSSEPNVFSSLPSLRAPCRRSFYGKKVLLVLVILGQFSISLKRDEIHFGSRGQLNYAMFFNSAFVLIQFYSNSDSQRDTHECIN